MLRAVTLRQQRQFIQQAARTARCSLSTTATLTPGNSSLTSSPSLIRPVSWNPALPLIRYFSSQPPPNQQQPPPWVNPDNQVPGQALEKYSIDLTKLAQEHKLDPIIGRHNEIRRCLQILARRTKNNAILIGEAGVGKVR